MIVSIQVDADRREQRRRVGDDQPIGIEKTWPNGLVTAAVIGAIAAVPSGARRRAIPTRSSGFADQWRKRRASSGLRSSCVQCGTAREDSLWVTWRGQLAM
jgi:hypothetical protein